MADKGVAALSARSVAERAGVSPALVIHHFGSMEALRTACDEHVAQVVRERKQEALDAGPGVDVLARLRDARVGNATGYLAAVLAEDSASVAALVDELVDDAQGYLESGVRSGMLQPSANPRNRAVVLTLWGLGVLVLNQHLKRLLGVDLTDPDADLPATLGPYAIPVYEIYSHGMFSPELAAATGRALAEMERLAKPPGTQETKPTSGEEK